MAPGKQIRRTARVAFDGTRPFHDRDTYRRFAEDAAAAGLDGLTVRAPRPDGRRIRHGRPDTRRVRDLTDR
ncbi:hypothetical protein ACIO6U_20205 [Streptomyces sp. NPDC087422]|uniref:hypothetical protein n=1 Tax=Streptomyces sp. NPDC087422 TaxID=3365786 RepID=UPI0037F4D577